LKLRNLKLHIRRGLSVGASN